MPPNHSDIHIEITQSPDQPPTVQRSNLSSLGGYHTAPRPAAHKAMVPIATFHHLSRLGGYNSATIAAKRCHTDLAQDNNNNNNLAEQSKATTRCKSKPAPTKHHRTRSHTKTAPVQDSRSEHPFPPLPIDPPPHLPYISGHQHFTAPHATGGGTCPHTTTKPHSTLVSQEWPKPYPSTASTSPAYNNRPTAYGFQTRHPSPAHNQALYSWRELPNHHRITNPDPDLPGLRPQLRPQPTTTTSLKKL